MFTGFSVKETPTIFPSLFTAAALSFHLGPLHFAILHGRHIAALGSQTELGDLKSS